jgi:hypothetical protein
LREDIFQTRYNSSSTRLTNFGPAHPDDYMEDILNNNRGGTGALRNLVSIKLGKQVKHQKKERLRQSMAIPSHTALGFAPQATNQIEKPSFFEKRMNKGTLSRNQKKMNKKYGNDLSMITSRATPFDSGAQTRA